MNSFYKAVDENGNNQIKPFTSKQFWIKLLEAVNWQLMDDEMCGDFFQPQDSKHYSLYKYIYVILVIFFKRVFKIWS